MTMSNDSFNTLSTLEVDGHTYDYFAVFGGDLGTHEAIAKLPKSTKILLENLLRHEDGENCTPDDIEALAASEGRASSQEIAFHPARVLVQDFTGVPALVDLAAMRHALVKQGVAPERINPVIPVDLVIDHSLSVESFANDGAFQINVNTEVDRNRERYAFLKWGQQALDNFRVVPPGTGICHQVNLEYLAKVVWTAEGNPRRIAYPDTLVGLDSHTTMINGLGVLGWGVGGIEAEAAMLGQPVSMLIPDVVGFELEGRLAEGITATDLVLRVVEMLREHGVVGCLVEFFGDGLDHLPLADRATIANMAPEYGATCGFFPVDNQTLTYLRLSGRDEHTIKLVETYTRAQGLWRDAGDPKTSFASTIHLDLRTVEPNLAGPKRPQDRVTVSKLKAATEAVISEQGKAAEVNTGFPFLGDEQDMHHGDVVVAAITSCTNTSNPAVMIGAGLLAKKALERGLHRKPWVKSSLAPGSKVVTEYLEKTGLQDALDTLGFHLVGYGCTTCIGNSGPLPEAVQRAIEDNDLVVSSVLSGNRNFEGRIHPLVRANWLASPPLVVAYALAGTTRVDLSTEPLGDDSNGDPVYLADVWPSNKEIADLVQVIDRDMFSEKYLEVFDGDDTWNAIDSETDTSYKFDAESTYVRLPPFFVAEFGSGSGQLKGARILALLGDSVTTDHISPAGTIPDESPAGQYLSDAGINPRDFNSFGSRRGNHEVMMRGTFGNIRIRNEMTPDLEGGYTRMAGKTEPLWIYDAAMRYQQQEVPLVVIAGKEYGTGSSRDWAAKGPLLLGVRAVIAESFERIHRSNLVGMGILPLEFPDGVNRKSLGLTGDEVVEIDFNPLLMQPKQGVEVTFKNANGGAQKITARSRIDTAMEVGYYQAGGVLKYVLNSLKN
jgi:aconitate hydratase